MHCSLAPQSLQLCILRRPPCTGRWRGLRAEKLQGLVYMFHTLRIVLLLDTIWHAVQMERSVKAAVAEVRALPLVAPPKLEALRLAHSPPGCFYPGYAG